MTAPSSTLDLSVTDLNVQFTDRGNLFTALAVDRLDVPAGSSLALTGPSGCGKSTLLYALAGLARPAGGQIKWGGRDIGGYTESARDDWRRRNIGFVFQDFELLPELSALQNVLVPATFARFRIDAPTRRRGAELLDMLGVPRRGGPVGPMSRGERQRVALARALLFDPPVILADEPTASLDARSGEVVIAALIEQSRGRGRTIIVASHDPALMDRLDGRLRLERGRVASNIGEAAA